MASASELYKWIDQLLKQIANQRAYMAQQAVIMSVMLDILEEDDAIEELNVRVQERTGEPMPDMLLEYSILCSSGPALEVADQRLKTLRNMITELDERQIFLEASMNLLEAKAFS